MAFQTARSRDPLLDTKMQAALERRTQEIAGLLLIGIAVMLGLALATYSPADPGWMSTGNGSASNMLGRTGAAVAAPLVLIVGKGAWGLMLVPLVWGVRLLFHIGSEGFGSRIIFAPIAVALGAVYASTLVPGETWVHSFGLGGLFGDTVLGATLGVLPISAALSLKILTILLAAALVASMLFVLGFSRLELYRMGSFALRGLLQTGRGLATGTANGIVWMRERRAARAAERDEFLPEAAPHDEPTMNLRARVLRAEPPLAVKDGVDEELIEPEHFEEQIEEKPGFLARVRARTLKTQAVANTAAAQPASEEDRVHTMISEAIRRRGDRDSSRSMILPKTPMVRGEEPPLMRAAVETATDVALDQLDDLVAQVDDVLVEEPDVQLVSQDPAAEEMPISSRRVALDRTAPVFQNTAETNKAMVQHPPKRPPQPSRQAQAEAQPALSFEERHSDFECPALSLLSNPVAIERHHLSDEALEENARMLESVLDDYGVKGEIVSVRPGPVVTMYELEPAPGLKASRVIGLADDIARSMSALAARVSTVPGRSVIGIELPNAVREKVVLREILSTRDFGDGNQRLPLALGKDIGGEAVVANLAKMPHLLIAGTTGSGKSVAINTMILSLLYKLTPDECRLIMIDPKMLELSVYDGIPHLLSPVVTDPKKAVVALKWVVGEMEERYRRMSKMGVRNIEGFNGRVRDTLSKGEMFTRTVQTGFDEETGDPIFETEETKPETLPYIVVIVDEMADLMMVAGKEIEACIQRLAQMARASGIHLIMATQRPSVDVITGTIKANFPTRISFQVTSKVDSRTILGEMGAEQLLGMGDMLYMAGGAKITRVHGPFVSDEEVEEVVSHLKSYGPPDYVGNVLDGPEEGKSDDIDLVLGLGGNTDGEDALYDQAVQIVIQDRKCSTSYIQRKLAIGYNKAARLVEQMEDNGLVSSANHVGKREILVPEQQ